MQRRDPKVTAIIGAKGHGKSTLIAKLVQHSLLPNALIYKTPLTIYDPAFSAFKYCPIGKYKGGKVVISSGDIKYKEFLRIVMARFRNGVVVIDDSAFHERHQMSEELEQFMNQCRHMNTDIIMVYHGLTKLPIQQISYLNNIVLCHTNDNADYKGDKLPGLENLNQVKEVIRRHVERGNKYYYENIKLA